MMTLTQVARSPLSILVGLLTLLVNPIFVPAAAFTHWTNINVSTRKSSNSSSGENAEKPKRQPWDVIRFLKQSSKFVTLPFAPRPAVLTQGNVQPGQILWNADANPSFTMAPLDDVVMGGISSSSFDPSDGRWVGVVSDENSGGFVGIRSTPSFLWNMEKCAGLEWKLIYNGKVRRRFKFVLRDSTEFNGITWTTSVDLKPGKNTVKIRFDKQIPALFAKTVPDQTFRKDNVVAVQIAYSKFEYDGKLNPNFELGPVDLQLLELRSF